MGTLLPFIVSLLSGAAGGNLAASLMKKFSLGTLGNSIVGILGGGLGQTIIGMLLGGGGTSGGMDIAGILSSVAGGGVGGGVLLAVIGMIKSAMNK